PQSRRICFDSRLPVAFRQRLSGGSFRVPDLLELGETLVNPAAAVVAPPDQAVHQLPGDRAARDQDKPQVPQFGPRRYGGIGRRINRLVSILHDCACLKKRSRRATATPGGFGEVTRQPYCVAETG